MAIQFVGTALVEENADLDALAAKIADATCCTCDDEGGGSSGPQTRHLAYTFDDGVTILPVGTLRRLYLRNEYNILAWAIQGFDALGNLTPVTAAFALKRRQLNGTVIDPVGAGSVPSINAVTHTEGHSEGDPANWENTVGAAQEVLEVALTSVSAELAVALLLTIYVEELPQAEEEIVIV